MQTLSIILVALLLSILINRVLKHFRIPTVIGYIATGIAVSLLFGLHRHEGDMLGHIAEFGIVFLMFMIGLEFSFKTLAAMWREVVLYGTLQLFITGLLLTLITHAAGIETKSAIIIAAALSLSSTAIVLKALQEKEHTHTPYGRSSVGILLFQDMAVIPILLMLTIFTSREQAMGKMLLAIVQDAVMVGVIMYLIGKYLLNPLLEWITRADSSEIFLATVLFLVIGSAQLAHLFGFSYSLGAFLAGMILSETRFKYQIEAKLISFRDLLMGLFFVTVGMQINLATIAAHPVAIVVTALGVMLLKFLVILGILYFFTRLRTAIKTALALSQIGEFALAIITLALSDGLLSEETAQILFGATVLSMVLSVFILTDIRRIADFLYPEPESLPAHTHSGMQNHIIVCGYGPMGRNVVKLLRASGVSYLILEHDIQAVALGQKRGEPIFFANAANTEILQHFDVAHAASVIVAVGNAHHLRLICEAFRALCDDVNLVIKAANRTEERMLEDLHVDHVVLQSEEMAKLLVKEALYCHL
ncbi:MAG TPA: potassium transporter [Campylobacteraceae bacterium]|nr:potassium transporter [Campylobacteraceae bacterium]HHD84249.1 potassium transporter [Campylobacteraceae bacterium]